VGCTISIPDSNSPCGHRMGRCERCRCFIYYRLPVGVRNACECIEVLCCVSVITDESPNSVLGTWWRICMWWNAHAHQTWGSLLHKARIARDGNSAKVRSPSLHSSNPSLYNKAMKFFSVAALLTTTASTANTLIVNTP